VNAIYGAGIHAGAIFDPDAGFGNDIGHIPSPSDLKLCPRESEFNKGDNCSAIKQPEEVWIVGQAAEAVGVVSARRAITIQSVWDRTSTLLTALLV